MLAATLPKVPMKRMLSLFLATMMAMLLVPSGAFAVGAGEGSRAAVASEFSIEHVGYDAHDARYEFTVRASAAADEPIDVAYRTFRGTTDNGFIEPVEGATITFQPGESEKAISIASAEPEAGSLDAYVESSEAKAQKYFGVALVGTSAGTISEGAQCATAPIAEAQADGCLEVVGTAGMLAADGSGEMVETKFSNLNNEGTAGQITGIMPIGTFNAYEQTAERNACYEWLLQPGGATHSFNLDIRQHAALSRYCYAAGGLDYLYSISYALDSEDPHRSYTDDVDAELVIRNGSEEVVRAAGDLEGWRTIDEVPGAALTHLGYVPIDVSLPGGADDAKAMTVAEYCAAHGIDMDASPDGNELVNGYESIALGASAGGFFASDEPLDLTGELTLRPTVLEHRYDADRNEVGHDQEYFDYGYSLTGLTLHYGARDARAPQVGVDADSGMPRVSFSQSEYVKGDAIRVSVSFDEIVSSWPQGQYARLTIPAAPGAPGASFDMELAGGVGTNVLEFTCAYDGSGATNAYVARDCAIALPAGIADMAGNATQEALGASASAAFTKAKNVTVPLAPIVTAADAEGNQIASGGVGYSDITLTFAQPDGDPAADAVVAYEASLNGGEDWRRIEAAPAPDGGKRIGTCTISAEGEYQVVARALVPGDIGGDASEAFLVARYGPGERPGTFWLEHVEGAGGPGKVIVHREGGSFGEQVVRVRSFRVDTEQADQLRLSARKMDGASDPVTSGTEVQLAFPAGFEGTREVSIDVVARDYEHKLGGQDCVAGVELASVREASGRQPGSIDRTRSCAYVGVPTYGISTKGIYALDPETGGPKLEAGQGIEPDRRNTESSIFVYPGQTEAVDLGSPFANVSGTEGNLDLYYFMEFHLEQQRWSFAGMYDVTTIHENSGVELFRGWEDYDNAHDDVNLPDDPSGINNAQLNAQYVVGPIDYVDPYPLSPDEANQSKKFFKAPNEVGDAGQLSVSLDSRLPQGSSAWLWYLTYDCYGVDRTGPVLKEWGVSDKTFYDGNEARVYLEFSEPVVSASVTARIWDKNHTKCYATLSASGPRSEGTTEDSLMGLGTKNLMLSGFQDGGEQCMPEEALLELEVADPTDFVGNSWHDPIKPDSKVVPVSTDVPPLSDHVDDDVPADEDTYGRFLISWNVNDNLEPGSFTIMRSKGMNGRQEVLFRTLWGTNDPENPFFEPVDSSVVFEEGQNRAIIKVNEREADKGDVGYYSAASGRDPVKRTYGVEIYDVHGGGEVAPEMGNRVAWRDVDCSSYPEEAWAPDFDGYLYEEGKENAFQRALCEEPAAKPIKGYNGWTMLTSFDTDANRYFRLTCDDMYTQMHMYQDKEKFEFTADDIYTRIYPGDGSTRELYCAHEDYDNTNHDHCYFPQDVPINSGNTVDDSSYTASVSGKSVDGRDITRVWRLPVSESDVVYNMQGYWSGQVVAKDGWLDYLFVDDVAPRPKTGNGAHGAFYPSATKLGAGDYFAVTVAFDEIVRIPSDEDPVLEVYDASGTTKLGEMGLASTQRAGASFRGHASALCFDGTMPAAYEGGTYVLKLAGTITDMAGNVMDMSDEACQDQVTVESDAIEPPTLTPVLDEAASYVDGSGTTWYGRASVRLSGNAANPADTANWYSLDGITFRQGDFAELAGEAKAQRVWAKCVAPNGEQSKVVASDPIAIDTVAPTLAPAADGAWTTPPAAIATNAADGGSGVARVEARGPGEASTPYGCQAVEVTENGAYELKAVDNLGNASEGVQVQVSCIDGTAPAFPGIRSAGAPVEVWDNGAVQDGSAPGAGASCYSAKLDESGAFTLAPSGDQGGSPERYRYSYALADADGAVTGESAARAWGPGVMIPASHAEGGLANSVVVPTSRGTVRGLGVYVYCEDEAGNSRRDLLVLDCGSLGAGTNVYVEPFAGTFGDDGSPRVSGAYEGEWTAESVIFAVRPELVGPGGVDDPGVTVDRIEYSLDDGATWTDVTDAAAMGTWRARGSGGSFEIAPSASAEVSERLRFRAVASSDSYVANASEAFPVNVDGRTPVAAVTLEDASGNALPLAPAADAFASTPVTVRIQAQAAHDPTFELSATRDGAWYPLGDACVAGDAATFTVGQPGISQMGVRVGSSTGLASAEVPFEVRIDMLAPRLELSGYAPGSADAADAANVLSFAVDDADADGSVAVSGPKALRYQVAHPDGTVHEGEGALAMAADGKSATGTVELPFEESGTVTVFAVDGAGNESDRVSRSVDECPPKLTVTPQASFASAPGKWYPSVTFDYEATDGPGGAVSVEYTEDGVAKRAEGASGRFTVSAEGVYDVVVTATDASGKTAEQRFRVQVVEAAVADVANEVAALPSPDAGEQGIWDARQGILAAVEDYLALTDAQRAKMPLDQLEKLEALYEAVLPVRSMDRLDDATGIRLVGLLLALDPSEIAIPDGYWDSADYPQDGFVLYEFEVKTRDLPEGGMTADELSRVVGSAGFAYQDGYMWDVVVEKRTYAADDAGMVVSREIIGSDRWREAASIVGLFPFADEFDGRDIRFVNVAPGSVEEVAYKPVDGSSGQGARPMASACLTHLSYYGFVEKAARPVGPGGGGSDGGAPSGSAADGYGSMLAQAGDMTAPLALCVLMVLASAAAGTLLLRSSRALPRHGRMGAHGRGAHGKAS